jgi:hypothetical protein
MYNEGTCCATNGCATNDCVLVPGDSMKQTIMILHDEAKKTRELAFEILSNLFGGKPPEIKEGELNCAQDVLNECRSIQEQNVAILNDILRGING